MRCENCQTELPPDSEACARCGWESRAATWSLVARVANLAEAGFLADRLEEQGFSVQLVQQQDFSALDGAGQQAFGLRVPEQQAMRAAQQLKLETALPEPDWEDRSGGSSTRIVTTTLLLLVLVGGVLLGFSRSLRVVAPAAGHRPRGAEALWKYLRNSPPLIQDTPDGRRRLRFDREAGGVLLEQEQPDGTYRPALLFSQ